MKQLRPLTAIVSLACSIAFSLSAAQGLACGELAENFAHETIEAPIEGLYESITSKPSEYKEMADGFKRPVFTKGTLKIESEPTQDRLGYEFNLKDASSATEGSRAVRFYDNKRRQLELFVANLEGLPKWVEYSQVPLVAGRGIPTSLFVNLLSMKMFGIKRGELAQLKASSIQNGKMIIELAKAKEQWLTENPGKEATPEVLGALLLNTESFRYIRTMATQSGHKITTIRVEGGLTVGADYLQKRVLGSKESLIKEAKKQGLYEDGEFTRNEFPFKFDVLVDLAPLTSR